MVFRSASFVCASLGGGYWFSFFATSHTLCSMYFWCAYFYTRTTLLQLAVPWWMRKVSPAFAFLTLSLWLEMLPHATISYKRPEPKRCTILKDSNCQNWLKNQNKNWKVTTKTLKVEVVLAIKHLCKVLLLLLL